MTQLRMHVFWFNVWSLTGASFDNDDPHDLEKTMCCDVSK